jgi:hypothetical protein
VSVTGANEPSAEKRGAYRDERRSGPPEQVTSVVGVSNDGKGGRRVNFALVLRVLLERVPTLLGRYLNHHPRRKHQRSNSLHRPNLRVVPDASKPRQERERVGTVREEVEDGDGGCGKDGKRVVGSEEGPVRVSEEGEDGGGENEEGRRRKRGIGGGGELVRGELEGGRGGEVKETKDGCGEGTVGEELVAEEGLEREREMGELRADAIWTRKEGEKERRTTAARPAIKVVDPAGLMPWILGTWSGMVREKEDGSWKADAWTGRARRS